MLTARCVAMMSSLGAVVMGTGAAYGQEYPAKPIRIITSGVGGGNDYVSRAIGPYLSASLGQPVITENRPSGILAAEAASKAAPDGYSLLFASNSLWIGPLIQKMPYDAFRDFTPITLPDKQPNLVVVHPSLPVKTVKELIALAKSRPGELNYASANIGSTNHLAAELFKAMANVNITRIPYKSVGPGLTDLLGGQIQLMFSTAAPAMPHVKSGKLRALAVTSAQPTALAPGMPTVAATVPGYESVSSDAIMAPAHTAPAIIQRLNQEIVRVLARQDIKEKFMSVGLETVGSTPEELAAVMKSDLTLFGKIIKDAGVKAD